jgi:hypothetical protein
MAVSLQGGLGNFGGGARQFARLVMGKLLVPPI